MDRLWDFGQEPENKKKTAIPFGSTKATFNQGDLNISKAIDGNRNNNNGWAIDGGTGKDQSALLVLKEPLNFTNPTQLVFLMEQFYQDNKHAVGRFRISVTDDPNPDLQGVPRDIDQILAVVSAARTEEQQVRLEEWFEGRSDERRQKLAAIEESKKPRPADPEVTKREQALKIATEPLSVDPQLTRLERAVKLSEGQLQDLRTTIAQDLAWALINSPSFLFNR